MTDDQPLFPAVRYAEQIKEANDIIREFDHLVESITGQVFQNVLDYYKKYGVKRDDTKRTN